MVPEVVGAAVAFSIKQQVFVQSRPRWVKSAGFAVNKSLKRIFGVCVYVNPVNVMRAGVSKLSKSPEVSTAIIPREKLTWPSRTTNEERFTSERNSSVPVFAFERVRFTFSSCELLRAARFGIVASVSTI